MTVTLQQVRVTNPHHSTLPPVAPPLAGSIAETQPNVSRIGMLRLMRASHREPETACGRPGGCDCQPQRRCVMTDGNVTLTHGDHYATLSPRCQGGP